MQNQNETAPAAQSESSPATAPSGLKLTAIEQINTAISEYQMKYREFKDGTKKSGLLAKKALTEVKKLIIDARREIAAEITAGVKKRE